MTRQKGSNLFVWVLLAVVAATGTMYHVTNETGVLRYRELSLEMDSLLQHQRKIEAENLLIEGSIDSLERKVPSKIARIARERYNMKKTNETVISVEER